MKAQNSLPAGYREVCRIDLQKDKKLALLVNGAALLIGVVMVVPMHFHISIATLFDLSEGFVPYLLRFLCMLLGLTLYIILHELVHAAAMRLSGTQKVNFGFTGLYAFAGSADYYDRPHYILIALAPIVVWGVVLGLLCGLVLGGLHHSGHQHLRRSRRPLYHLPDGKAATGPAGSGLRCPHDSLCATDGRLNTVRFCCILGKRMIGW